MHNWFKACVIYVSIINKKVVCLNITTVTVVIVSSGRYFTLSEMKLIKLKFTEIQSVWLSRIRMFSCVGCLMLTETRLVD